MLPTLTGLPSVTLFLVGGPILTRSSNPALRGVNLEVVGGPSAGLPARPYFYHISPDSHCSRVVALSEKSKYHSVWLYEIGHSCTSVFLNTRAWEQQEWNKIKINKQINKFYFANEGMKTGTWVTTVQITRAKINQIRLREPLEIQTIHPTKFWNRLMN